MNTASRMESTGENISDFTINNNVFRMIYTDIWKRSMKFDIDTKSPSELYFITNKFYIQINSYLFEFFFKFENPILFNYYKILLTMEFKILFAKPEPFSGSAWRIHISQATRDKLEAAGGYSLEYRGRTEVKGKGRLPTYWLLGKAGFDKALPSPPPIG